MNTYTIQYIFPNASANYIQYYTNDVPRIGEDVIFNKEIFEVESIIRDIDEFKTVVCLKYKDSEQH